MPDGPMVAPIRNLLYLNCGVTAINDTSVPEEVLEEHALLFVGGWLQQQGYRFATVTPATQARVNARLESARAGDLRDVFGWSRPFPPCLLYARVLGWLRQADLLRSAERTRTIAAWRGAQSTSGCLHQTTCPPLCKPCNRSDGSSWENPRKTAASGSCSKGSGLRCLGCFRVMSFKSFTTGSGVKPVLTDSLMLRQDAPRQAAAGSHSVLPQGGLPGTVAVRHPSSSPTCWTPI